MSSHSDTSLSLVTLFPDGLRGKRVHAVGAGGSGISAVLRLAAEQGAFVTGCDVAETTMAKRLNAQGVVLTTEADESTTGPASFVVVDPDGNPVLVDQHR